MSGEGGFRNPSYAQGVVPQSTQGKSLRDEWAEGIMFKALDNDWSLWRDPAFLAAQSYRIADAMMKARGL